MIINMYFLSYTISELKKNIMSNKDKPIDLRKKYLQQISSTDIFKKYI